MTFLDANVLLYAHNRSASQYPVVRPWLTALLESGQSVGLPWASVWAFLRISTNPRALPIPLSARQAFQALNQITRLNTVTLVKPGPRHLEILQRLMLAHSVSGSRVTDAVLAALAIEHGATLASTDQDFSRFDELRWINPLRQ